VLLLINRCDTFKRYYIIHRCNTSSAYWATRNGRLYQTIL